VRPCGLEACGDGRTGGCTDQQTLHVVHGSVHEYGELRCSGTVSGFRCAHGTTRPATHAHRSADCVADAFGGFLKQHVTCARVLIVHRTRNGGGEIARVGGRCQDVGAAADERVLAVMVCRALVYASAVMPPIEWPASVSGPVICMAVRT
jgi:hypothetical protein